ncbi:MAG: ubiquinol-cytochrome c reductase iron-sulfur subunit [Planctomycetales bacterium]|nr:ubiquinol-cytochrome c reductase iron-sulfur subunit [Planctomycetales bacterium]
MNERSNTESTGDSEPLIGPNTSEPSPASSADDGASRRSLLASALMAGGLAGGYGTFFAMAGRYFYRPGTNDAWLFVTSADSVPPGQSIPFESPSGLRVTVTREADADVTKPSTAEQFLALSSVCPHLGCQVHWEPHNNRYFCPCHNGVFDPSGKAIEGPPAADGQNLFQYPLKIETGSLYIAMPFRAVGQS